MASNQSSPWNDSKNVRTPTQTRPSTSASVGVHHSAGRALNEDRFSINGPFDQHVRTTGELSNNSSFHDSSESDNEVRTGSRTGSFTTPFVTTPTQMSPTDSRRRSTGLSLDLDNESPHSARANRSFVAMSPTGALPYDRSNSISQMSPFPSPGFRDGFTQPPTSPIKQSQSSPSSKGEISPKRLSHRPSLSTLPENPESPAAEYSVPVGASKSSITSRHVPKGYSMSDLSRFNKCNTGLDEPGGVSLSASNYPHRSHSQTFSHGQPWLNFKTERATSLPSTDKSIQEALNCLTLATKGKAQDAVKATATGKDANRISSETEGSATRAKTLAELIKAGEFDDSTENEAAGNPATVTYRPLNFISRRENASVASENTIQQEHSLELQTPTSGSVTYMPHIQAELPPLYGQNAQDPTVQHLHSFGNNVPPTIMMACQPFVNKATNGVASAAGVIKISDVCGASTSNKFPTNVIQIPYNASRQEIVAFVGKNARLVQFPPRTPFYAIHIIMERATAKSMDAYVEFETAEDAVIAAQRFQREPRGLIKEGVARRPRIGDRTVKVELSSQAKLMRELFPRAKCVNWEGQQPVLFSPTVNWASGFTGFITPEELHNTVRYATHPNRSRFACKHVQRTYESMISIVQKYPWWCTELYTVEERNNIFRACCDMIQCLSSILIRGENREGATVLTPQLLEELLCVGLTCPAFSEKQRSSLLQSSQWIVGCPRWVSPTFASTWPFEALVRADETSEQLVHWYAAKLKSQNRALQTSNATFKPVHDNPFGGLVESAATRDPRTTAMLTAINHEFEVVRRAFDDPDKLFPPQIYQGQAYAQVYQPASLLQANQYSTRPSPLMQTVSPYQSFDTPGYQFPPGMALFPNHMLTFMDTLSDTVSAPTFQTGY